MGNIICNITSTIDLAFNFLQGLLAIVISKFLAAVWREDLRLNNIQGDIILGLPKKMERFIFLQILVPSRFRRNLHRLVPTITTMTQVLNDRNAILASKETSRARGTRPPLIPLSGTNIAFSYSGLEKLGIKGNLNDAPFRKGQKAESARLGDPRTQSDPSDPNWLPEFKEKIDVLILITGDSPERIARRTEEVEEIFALRMQDASARVVYTLDGNVRPGALKGHEHFGFQDGISQPGIQSFTTLYPGQEAVPAGIALCRNTGDPRLFGRPGWSKDGSFLVFRYLEQLVPEFESFLKQNPIKAFDLPPEKGSELLGARMVGRWKSGAPVDLSPHADDPKLGQDPLRNNSFDFSGEHNQDRCPYAAHIRKTNPRADQALLGGTSVRRIWRQGIQFGPEVTDEERSQGVTLHRRGLAFVCYQSSIDNGFNFIQQAWCNNIAFPVKLLPPTISGFDPIMGLNKDKARDMFDPEVQGMDLVLPIDFVVPKGGEYFFSPSIRALKDVFSLKN